MSIAPYHVEICALNPDRGGVMEASEALYGELTKLGVEVLFDDRGEKAGFMFNDADLIGIPFRVIVSPKSMEKGVVEFKLRGSRDAEMIPLADAAKVLAEKVKDELKKYE